MSKEKYPEKVYRGLFPRLFLLMVIGLSAYFFESSEGNTGGQWLKVAEGLKYREFEAPVKSTVGDSRIAVLNINPQIYDFKLICASELDQKPRTIEDWGENLNLIAAINAGMFQQDLLTSVGYLKNYEYYNNPYLNNNNSIFAFNPVDTTQPPVRLIDRTCDDFDELKGQYHCFLQSIRMLSCRQENVWSLQKKQWSIAALAIDNRNHVLFLFSLSPYPVHTFINMALTLPLSIQRMMYLEGGSAASFYLSVENFKVVKYGSFETGFLENGHISTPLPIPNVLGIVKRK